MKITLENTTKIVHINGVPARIWAGQTESGIPVHCYVTLIAVPEGRPAEEYAKFEQELQTCKPPTPDIDAISLRLLL